jgi:hypothetical protein
VADSSGSKQIDRKRCLLQTQFESQPYYDCAYWDKDQIEIKAYEQQYSTACVLTPESRLDYQRI